MTQHTEQWYLTGRGHRVPTADGTTTRDALHRDGYWSPMHGVLVAPDATPPTIAAAVLAALPDHLALGHLTAARMHGIPLPTRWQPRDPVDLVAGPDARIPRRRGVRTRRDPHLVVVGVRGLRCSSLTSTWRQLTTCLAREDLVAVADSVLGRVCSVEGTITTDLLAASLPWGARGTARGLRALERADGRAASRPETHLRLLVSAWALPAPEVNADVYDDHGQWLGCSDLVWRTHKVAAEYEGDHHRTDRRQWQLDIERLRLYEAAGWTVIRATGRDLHRPSRLREALERALRPGAAAA